MKFNLIELALVLLAALTPLFILAHEVSGDEFLKATSGVLLAATVAAIVNIYGTWRKNNRRNNRK